MGGLTTNQAYTIADVLGIPLQLDTGTGTLSGTGEFSVSLGSCQIKFELEVAGGSGDAKGAFAVARSRGNLLILVGCSVPMGRTVAQCAFVDVARAQHWREWLAATKARSFEKAAGELGKAVVARFSRAQNEKWSRVS